jgi:hypothetical protein
MNGSHCGNLVEKTAAALNEEAVMLMLLVVQRGECRIECEASLETVSTSIKLEKVSKNLNKNCSVQRLVTFEVEDVIRECLIPFPYIWASVSLLIDGLCLFMLYLFNPQLVRASSYL